MNVRVRYFGQVRHLVGREAEDVSLADGADVDALLRLLAARTPTAANVLSSRSLLAFLSDEPIDRGFALREGDEVTLLALVAGGGR